MSRPSPGPGWKGSGVRFAGRFVKPFDSNTGEDTMTGRLVRAMRRFRCATFPFREVGRGGAAMRVEAVAGVLALILMSGDLQQGFAGITAGPSPTTPPTFGPGGTLTGYTLDVSGDGIGQA